MLELAGRTLGEFVVKKKLGAGGFGTVYLADQPLLGREAVVKVLHASALQNPELRHRFLREARLASAVDHPFAAHVYSFGAEPDGILWMAMELVRGTPLNEWLGVQGPIPLSRFAPLFDKLCEVVHTLHSQGIIHRDLKPANVMVLSRSGRLLPKLLDLGIAKFKGGPERVDGAPAHRSAPSDDAGLVTIGVERTPATGPTPRHLVDTPPREAGSGDSMRLTVGAAGSSWLTVELDRSAVLELTSGEGGTLGSPAYMAPEQWASAHDTDARTDVYALGVLAFQALTGGVPFREKTAVRLAAAHLKEPPPHLGDGFPPAVDAVIQRALAKAPKDRFPDALSLAGAFREAAGGSEEAAALPQLGHDLRDIYLQELPQPLAEIVAMLDAAQRPGQLWQGLRLLTRTSIHYLAIIALAARARVGTEKLNARVLDLLRALGDGGLSELQWWELTRELCKPFVRYPDVHPVPELVRLCFAPDGAAPLEHPELALLLGEDASSEAGSIERLSACVGAMEAWLKRLQFLRAYTLVQIKEGSLAESWSGLRRSHRSRLLLQGDAPPAGQMVLASAERQCVLTFGPLLQAIAPTPGAPDETFLLAGAGRYGAKLVAPPLSFERYDEELWGWFTEHLADLRSGVALLEQAESAPYLGLSSFTAEQAKNFFGREREAEAFANRLRMQALVAVVGPSGAGKSSFVQAGVVPLLPASWQVVTVRPGTNPLAALADRLHSLGLPEVGLADALSEDPRTLGAKLSAYARQKAVTLLVVVDQFEELITLCRDERERRTYAEALTLAARSVDEPVRVVLTLRDDFLIRVQALPALRERLPQGLQLLSTPARDDLLRILTEPARRSGYQFETPELPEEMVSAVAQQPSALALLSFTASQLWELRDRDRKVLTGKAYTTLGGVGGALAHHAEATLSTLGERAQKLVREAFRHLVTAEGTRAILTRRQMMEILGHHGSSEETVERLISARLLVASEGADGEDRLEVVHEALLSSWPRLVQWQKEDAENVRMRDSLRAAARQWEERGRSHGLLWRGDALLEYRLWRSRYPGGITRLEEEFARASFKDEARGRRIRRGLGATAILGLVVGLLFVMRAYRQASSRLAELHFEQGRLSMLGGKPRQAMVYLDQAMREGIDGPGIRYLLQKGMRFAEAERGTLTAHEAPVTSIALSPDERILVSASSDGAIKIWDRARNTVLRTLQANRRAVRKIAISPNGELLAQASTDGSIRIWELASGSLQETLTGHQAPIDWVVFSPDGAQLASGSRDKTARVWDVASGRALATLSEKVIVSQVVFSPDGNTVATCPGPIEQPNSVDFTATLWDARTGRMLHQLVGHQGPVRMVAFSPNGTRVATASDDHSVKIWDAQTGRELSTLRGHLAAVAAVAFSRDGRLLVTGSYDKTARVWRAETGALVSTLAGHAGTVTLVQFSPDGSMVISGSNDSTARSWDVATGRLRWAYVGHDQAVSDMLLADHGTLLVTGSEDGTVRLWDAQRRLQTGQLPSTVQDVSFLVWGRGDDFLTAGDRPGIRWWRVPQRALAAELPWDGSNLASAGWSADGAEVALYQRGEVHVYAFPSGRQLGSLAGHSEGVSSVTFSRDGRLLLTTGQEADTSAQLWDTRTWIRLSRWVLAPNIPLTAADIRPDGKVLAIGAKDGSIHFFDVAGHELRSWSAHAGFIGSLVFSPDGRLLVSASVDRYSRVWDAATGALRATLRGHTASLVWAQFSVDGKLLVTSSYDGVVKVWDTSAWTELDSFEVGEQIQGAVFVGGGDEILTMGNDDGWLALWPSGRSTAPAEAIHQFVRCRIPLKLEGQQVVPSGISDSGPCGH